MINIKTFDKDGNEISKFDCGILSISAQINKKYKLSNIIRFTQKRLLECRRPASSNAVSFQLFLSGNPITKRINLLFADKLADRLEELPEMRKLLEKTKAEKQTYGRDLRLTKIENFCNRYSFY